MSDYTELVKKLRDLHHDPRPASAVWLFENQVALYDAAAAIEALQAEVRKYHDAFGRLSKTAVELEQRIAELKGVKPQEVQE